MRRGLYEIVLEDDLPAETIVARGEDYLLIHPVPDGPLAEAVGEFAARRRKSLERIVGNEHVRAEVLGTPIRGDRICAVVMTGRVVGYLSYRCDGAGATVPVWGRYRAHFGMFGGSVRYLATQATLIRGRASDLYIEGFALLPETRGRGLGRALLDWLGREVVRRGKSAWRTEMPAGHDAAQAAYERAGARRVRTVWLGPVGWLLGTPRLSLFRWIAPDR